MKPSIRIERTAQLIDVSPRRTTASALRPRTDLGAAQRGAPGGGLGHGNPPVQLERDSVSSNEVGSNLGRQRRQAPSVRRTPSPAPTRRMPSTDCELSRELTGQPERARFHGRLQQVVDNPLLSLLFFSSLIAMTFLV
jgi:hypothetical protein